MYFLELTLSKSEKGKVCPQTCECWSPGVPFKIYTWLAPPEKSVVGCLAHGICWMCTIQGLGPQKTLFTWLMHDQGHRHEAGLRCGSSHSQVLPSSVVALPKKKPYQNSSWIIREASYILSAPVLPLHDSPEMLSEAPPFPSKLLSRASQLCQRHQSNIWGYFIVTCFQVFHNISFTFSHNGLTWLLPQAD